VNICDSLKITLENLAEEDFKCNIKNEQ
jgi:hypothetical protein